MAMESTGTTLSLETKPASLAAAVGGFVDGAIELADVRDRLVREIQDDPESGGSIQELLESELNAGRLTIQDYTQLVEGINAALSESVPTEASEEAPDRPGFYNIDHEGTLILAEEGDEAEEDASKPVAAFDGVEQETPTPAEKKFEVQVGTILCDRYRLDEEIARGSMGMVYQAVDLEKLRSSAKDPRVAVKVISPEYVSEATALKTFENEIANTRHLDHPNIVKLYALEQEDSNYFISMEWLEGEALDILLDRSEGSALPAVQTYAIIEQLCDALAYAHDNNVVHADVKPGNVFLVKTGELKLIDFGIASIDAAAGTGNSGNGLGGVALTPAYASCERLEKSPPTAQDDLFSLACMIYRLLAGRRVFGSLTALEAEQQGKEPVPIGEMDDARWAALLQALSFRRADRQESVRAFAAAFKPAEPAEADAEEPFAETAIIQALPDDLLSEDLLAALPDDPSAAAEQATEAAPVQAEELAEPTGIQTLHGTTELSALAGLTEGETVMQPMAEEGISDTELLESFADFESLADTGLGKPVTDTTKIEVLNETSELLSLAGESAPARSPQEGVSPLEAALEFEEPEPEPEPEPPPPPLDSDFNLFDDPAAASGSFDSDGEPATDFNATADLGEMPEVVNIVDGDGSGFLPSDDVDPTVTIPNSGSAVAPAVAENTVPHELAEGGASHTVPTLQVPTSAIAEATTPAETPPGVVPPSVVPDGPVPQLKVRSVPKTDEAGDTEEPAEAVKPDGKIVPEQLRGSGQKQVYSDGRREHLQRLLTLLRHQPRTVAVAGGGLVVLVALAVTAVAILTGDDAPAQATAAVTAVSEEPDIEVIAPEVPDAPIMLDLTAPGMTATAAGDVSTGSAAVIKEPDVVRAEEPALVSVQAAAPVEPQPITLPPPSEFVLGLQSKVEQSLRDDRLVKPANNSFVYWIGRLRNEGGDMPMILALEAEAAGIFIARAEDVYIKGDMDAADRWADLAEEYGASELEITPVRAAVANYRRANPPGAAKPSAKSAPRPTQKLKPTPIEVKKKPEATEKVDQTLIGRFPAVALSKLEFSRYVDPRYPSTNVDRSLSGWVDVAFTVDKNGRPQNILVTGTNLPDRFEPPAIAAVKTWRFMPYAPDGKPQVVNTSVRMEYQSPDLAR